MSKRTAGLIELVAVLLIVAGCCALVAAASMVSTALAVLVAALVLIFAGVVGVYLASALEGGEPLDRTGRGTP